METPKSSWKHQNPLEYKYQRHSIAGTGSAQSTSITRIYTSPNGQPATISSPMFHSADRPSRHSHNHSHNRTIHEEGSIRSSALYTFSTVNGVDSDGFRRKMNETMKFVNLQQDQISQAIAAIKYCRRNNNSSDTLQEISARRLLLIAQERLKFYTNEMEIMKDMPVDAEVPIDRNDGTRRKLTINMMVLYLNRSFGLKLLDADTTFVFVIICRYENQIHATQLGNIFDMGKVRHIRARFKEHLIFENLLDDYKILLEVYALKIEKRSKFLPGMRSMRNLGKLLISCHSPSSGTIQESNEITSGFQRCGYIFLDRESITKQQFFLNDALYPLEGTVEITSELEEREILPEPERQMSQIVI